MSFEVGVPTLGLAKHTPRLGMGGDSGTQLATALLDEPLSGRYSRIELTPGQERIADKFGVPIAYEQRDTFLAVPGTASPNRTYLDVKFTNLGSARFLKHADMETAPPLDGRQRKGLRKIEKPGATLLGLFVD